MSPEVRQLLEDLVALGDTQPVLPYGLKDLRVRARRLLGTPAEDFQPGNALTNAGAPSSTAELRQILKRTANRVDADGELCWCCYPPELDTGEFGHDKLCRQARAALASTSDAAARIQGGQRVSAEGTRGADC